MGKYNQKISLGKCYQKYFSFFDSKNGLKNIRSENRTPWQKHPSGSASVDFLRKDASTFARCPSAAAVDPATVTLVNVPANIFFQYPVNKFERPRTW